MKVPQMSLTPPVLRSDVMVILCIVLLVLLILFCIAMARAGIIIEYGENDFSAVLQLGFIHKKIYPAKQKDKQPKKEKEKKPPKTKEEKGGSFDRLKQMLPDILEVIGRFRRKLQIDDLKIHLKAGGSDPAGTALLYGRASAGLGILTTVLNNAFIIKDSDIKTSIDFDDTKTKIYIKARLTLRVWEIFYVGSGFGTEFIKTTLLGKNRKVEQ